MKVSDIKTLDNVSAIYCFRNTINNKCYVGQAEQLRKRLLHHINNFKNCRYDAPLYRAMTKYGLDAFEVEILEIIDGLSDRMEIKKKLDEFEIYYIKHLNSYAPNGYNQTDKTDSPMFDPMVAKKMSDTKRKKYGKRVCEIDSANNIIAIWNSLAEAGEITGLDRFKISSVCNGCSILS